MVLVAVPDRQMQLFLERMLPTVTTIRWDWRDEPFTEECAAIGLLVSEYSPVPPTPELLSRLTRLAAVQVPSSGVEGWAEVIPPGVALCNGTGVHGQSTAEAAVSGVLALLRRLPQAVRQQDDRAWRSLTTAQLSGRRVVLLGAGDVARRIAVLTKAFGCPTTLVGTRARAGVHGVDELPVLLPGAQVLIISLPLTDATRGMVDAALLRRLPDDAVVANVSRGPVVDTIALTAEVGSGRLRAYLDVTDPEPLPTGHPLWAAPDVLITPHTGGADIHWHDRYQELVADQISRLLAGSELVNVVKQR